MGLIQRFLANAARELASDPEKREQAKRVYKDDVEPAAREAWREAQPEVQKAKKKLFDFAKDVKKQFRDGLEGR